MNNAATPLLKFGVLTDNHLSPALPQNIRRTEQVFQLFQQHHVDAVVNCGDITDRYDPEMIAEHNRIFDQVFADGGKPEKVWIAAGHDVAQSPDKEKAYAEIACLLDSGGLTFVKEIKGFIFIGISQEQPWNILEELLQKSYRNDGKPVFVITHEPPLNTVLKSEHHFFRDLRNILNRYPDCINISGHTHTPVMLDNNIWQGEFSAVNAGSLFYWKDIPFGTASRKLDSCNAMIVEVYDHQIRIRRFDMLTGTETENPWSWSLPYRQENAPYVPSLRSETFAIPEFSAGTGFRLEFDAIPFCHAICKFPAITPFEAFHHLRMELMEEQNGIMVPVSVFDFCNDYRCDTDHSCTEIPVGLLKGNGNYKIKMTPMNLYGKAGKSVTLSFQTPECGLTQLPYAGVTGILRENGCVSMMPEFTTTTDMETVHILLHGELQKHKDVPLFAVLEIESEHRGNPAILMAHGDRPDYGRHYLPSGKTGVLRQSFALSHLTGNRYSIFLGEGTPGKYKICSIKYFKITTTP